MEAVAQSKASHNQKVVPKKEVIPEKEEDMDNDHDKKRTGGGAGAGGSGGGAIGTLQKGCGGTTGTGGSSGSSMRCCQAERCSSDLSDAKQYHKRHKVCEHHAKAQVVIVAGIRQRFCQQCSRFHELSEFDEAKRSCRRRLAGHNERRRKSSSSDNSHVEGGGGGGGRKGTAGGSSSSHEMKEVVCGQVDDKGRIKINIQENATFKHFQIR